MSHITTSIFDVAAISVGEAQETMSHPSIDLPAYRWQNILVHTASGDAVSFTLHFAPGFEGLPSQHVYKGPIE